MDTVVGGRGTKACLLVLTERLSRQEIIIKMAEKTSENIIKSIKTLKDKYKNSFSIRFKTITVDNGSEFMNAKAIEKLEVQQVYYTHSYCSYERGSNENANRFYKKIYPKRCEYK